MPLRRELGLFSAALVVVGGIIGSGIFFTPATTAAALPSGAWVIFVWALGGVVALAGALTYAELGAMLPEAGGPYVYIREAFGALPAFLCAWMTAGLIASGAIAAVAMGFAGYLSRFVAVGAVGGRLGVAAITIVALTVARGFATAFVAVLFTIGGWQQMNMIAGEIKDPARNIPRALGIGIGIVIAVYLAVTG